MGKMRLQRKHRELMITKVRGNSECAIYGTKTTTDDEKTM